MNNRLSFLGGCLFLKANNGIITQQIIACYKAAEIQRPYIILNGGHYLLNLSAFLSFLASFSLSAASLSKRDSFLVVLSSLPSNLPALGLRGWASSTSSIVSVLLLLAGGAEGFGLDGAALPVRAAIMESAL